VYVYIFLLLFRAKQEKRKHITSCIGLDELLACGVMEIFWFEILSLVKRERDGSRASPNMGPARFEMQREKENKTKKSFFSA
jgi:hypothetical protein